MGRERLLEHQNNIVRVWRGRVCKTPSKNNSNRNNNGTTTRNHKQPRNTQYTASHNMAGAEIEYSEEERSALKGIFDLYDRDQIGTIASSDLGAILEKIGRSPEEAAEMLKDTDPQMSGSLSFDDFLMLLKKKDSETQALGEGPDPKVIEFLHILDEYRIKCEDEGNYLEAGRAAKQLETLKKQEAKRQEKALRARQLAERQDVQIAHNMQYAEFNAAWDKYLEEYDQMAHMYIQQMTERHAVTLREFQEDLHRQVCVFLC